MIYYRVKYHIIIEQLLRIVQLILIIKEYQLKYRLIVIIILARTPEIGQGLGRILSYGARKQEQT